jgi:peptidoglycan hydrolase-like protein with peptidoglycan-binding domain
MFVNELLGYEKEVNEYILLKTTEVLEEKMAQSSDSILKILPTTTEELDRMYLQTIDNDNTKKNKESVSPSINDVLSGKMDTSTQKKYTINYGQKGESVKEVQKMLDTLEYDLTNYGTVQNWNDGIFGEGTKMAVQYFQEDNGLTVNGIVDSNTLKKLTDIYNKNINNG